MFITARLPCNLHNIQIKMARDCANPSQKLLLLEEHAIKC